MQLNIYFLIECLNNSYDLKSHCIYYYHALSQIGHCLANKNKNTNLQSTPSYKGFDVVSINGESFVQTLEGLSVTTRLEVVYTIRNTTVCPLARLGLPQLTRTLFSWKTKPINTHTKKEKKKLRFWRIKVNSTDCIHEQLAWVSP